MQFSIKTTKYTRLPALRTLKNLKTSVRPEKIRPEKIGPEKIRPEKIRPEKIGPEAKNTCFPCCSCLS